MTYPEFPYCQIGDENREHLKTLLRWLQAEARSAGGDGDALWFSHYFRVEDLLPLIEEIKDAPHWSVDTERNSTIWWGYKQEGVIITNNEELFKNSPDWYQVKIRY